MNCKGRRDAKAQVSTTKLDPKFEIGELTVAQNSDPWISSRARLPAHYGVTLITPTTPVISNSTTESLRAAGAAASASSANRGTVMMSGDDQVAIENVGASFFLNHPEFQRGVDDVRRGRPPSFDRAGQNRRDRIDSQWAYERGRQFGLIAPRRMQLRTKSRLNLDALRLLVAAVRARDIVRWRGVASIARSMCSPAKFIRR